MANILFLGNIDSGLYYFRKELIAELVKKHKVYISVPYGEFVPAFQKLGCHYIKTNIARRGTNIADEITLLLKYIKILKAVDPDLTLTFTIKPNIYGGIATKLTGKKVMHSMVGLGTVFIKDLWFKKIITFLYKLAFAHSESIFFLNQHNKNLFEDLKIIKKSHNTVIIPGSGVNLNRFPFVPYPSEDSLRITFIGRIVKEKGIEEFIKAAESVKKYKPQITFEVVGRIEETKYKNILNQKVQEGIIKYKGERKDIPEIMAKTNCIVLPSYGEGRGTVLQEGAATGRPLITCDTFGCKDNVDENHNGYLCKARDAESLEECIKKFIRLPYEKKVKMGINSREKAKNEFDRNQVVSAFLKEIDIALVN